MTFFCNLEYIISLPSNILDDITYIICIILQIIWACSFKSPNCCHVCCCIKMKLWIFVVSGPHINIIPVKYDRLLKMSRIKLWHLILLEYVYIGSNFPQISKIRRVLKMNRTPFSPSQYWAYHASKIINNSKTE
jgi:hypothetical protein